MKCGLDIPDKILNRRVITRTVSHNIVDRVLHGLSLLLRLSSHLLALWEVRGALVIKKALNLAAVQFGVSPQKP